MNTGGYGARNETGEVSNYPDLQAELARLRAEKEELLDAVTGWHEWCVEEGEEVARLREALETIYETEEGKRLFGGLLRNALKETNGS